MTTPQTVTLASLTGCSGVVATTFTLGTTENPAPFTSNRVNCCPANTCCSTDTTATDACCNKAAKAATATAGKIATTSVIVNTYNGNVKFPFPNCALTTGSLAGCTTVVVSPGAAVPSPQPAANKPVGNFMCCDSMRASCCPVGTTSSCCSASSLYVNTLKPAAPTDYTMLNAVPIAPVPASQCPVPAPLAPAPTSSPAGPQPAVSPSVTNTDTMLPAALTAVLAALAFVVLFIGLPAFGAAGLGRKKRSLKTENDINNRLDEATSVIKRLIEAAQESYGIEADCSDATVAE